ncbi:hypothetical protein BGZ60DRAFT_529326 [Tricladium varicosporioides]|nr:hypothetical protein BGZ60DRAFT_529326 [Hymenoscyphus varicosporioides]
MYFLPHATALLLLLNHLITASPIFIPSSIFTVRLVLPPEDPIEFRLHECLTNDHFRRTCKAGSPFFSYNDNDIDYIFGPLKNKIKSKASAAGYYNDIYIGPSLIRWKYEMLSLYQVASKKTDIEMPVHWRCRKFWG